MARDSGLGGVLKIALVGGAGYFGYNYLVNSGLWAQWFGPAVPAGSVTPPASSSVTPPVAVTPGGITPPVSAPPAPPITTFAPVSRTALIAAAGGPGVPLNVDQWVYYYSKITGQQVTGSQVNTLLVATNQSATDRGALLTADQFLAVLPTAGLSGFGAVRRPVLLARAAWGAKTPARALAPNYVRRGAPMIRRR